MAHIFIMGVSETGKSTLARKIHRGVKNAGYTTLACDPLGSREWIAEQPDYMTRNFPEFVSVYEQSRLCYAFVDECHLIRDATERNWLGSMNALGRHYGHTNVFIGHRATNVPKSARMLATRLMVFKQAPDDAKELYGDYPHEEIRQLPYLKQGEYLDITSFACVRRSAF